MLADSSKLARLLISILLPILILRYLLHLLFYFTSPNKYLIDIDLDNEISQYKIAYKSKIACLIWAIKYDPYFLSLFYYRIGPSKTTLCSLIKKDRSTCSIIFGGGNLLGIKMFHPFATIINAAYIGQNLSIRNNTTIGNTHGSQNNRPYIGDNVDIGANVVIIGKIKIGNNVTIGAGTIICKDIPDNAIIVGNPARIIGYNENIRN